MAVLCSCGGKTGGSAGSHTSAGRSSSPAVTAASSLASSGAASTPEPNYPPDDYYPGGYLDYETYFSEVRTFPKPHPAPHREDMMWFMNDLGETVYGDPKGDESEWYNTGVIWGSATADSKDEVLYCANAANEIIEFRGRTIELNKESKGRLLYVASSAVMVMWVDADARLMYFWEASGNIYRLYIPTKEVDFVCNSADITDEDIVWFWGYSNFGVTWRISRPLDEPVEIKNPIADEYLTVHEDAIWKKFDMQTGEETEGIPDIYAF
jgi:hypothetical protein